ncbi:MAG: MarR family transcriptional regulator [Candidatus Odinarchaeota archaeon]
MLLNFQKNKLIELDYDSGITINTKILENKEVYEQAILFIDNSYKNLSKELISLFFSRFIDKKEPSISFNGLYEDFEYYRFKYKDFPVEENLTSISSGKEDLQRGKNNDISEVSLGHSVLDLSALYKWLEEKKWEYCIWISKTDRDHDKGCIGQLDPDGFVFRKLVEGFNLTFSNEDNGWRQIIYAKDGLYFSWAINKNGYLRFWINDYLSWERFFKSLQKKVEICNLTTEEFKELIEILEDSEKKKLFKLETANLIGPREIIEREFNKACLVYEKVYFDGLYLPVQIHIDKSKGPYEIEFKGAEGPTRRVQDVTVRAFETVQSLGQLDYKLDSALEVGVANNQQITVLEQKILPKQELQSEFSELNARILNLDIKNDIQQLDIKERIEYLKRLFPKLKDTIIELNNEGSIERAKIRDNIANLIVEILNLDTNIQGNINEAKKMVEDLFLDTSNEIQNVKDEIIQKIESSVELINKNIDNLKDYIFEEFIQVRSQVKNALYLTLRKLDQLPGITAKKIAAELKVSQKTIYSYLKKLQDKDLVNFEIKESNGPGRPPKIFKLNLQKLIKIIEKRKKPNGEN